MRNLCLILVCLFAVACGDDNNLSGPSNTIPNVAGNYRGSTTVAFPELNQTAVCSTTTSVTQSGGGNINIAPLQLQCPNVGLLSLPLGSGTIDATGSLGSYSGSYNDTCGIYNYNASGGFFGKDLRISMFYTSISCYNMNITINVSRS
jgi:hypothetical protein